MAQKLLKQYETKFNNKERYSLLKLSQFFKEKKLAEAEKLLYELKSEPCSKIVHFYLLQVLLMQSKVDEAIELLKTFDEYKEFKLGLVIYLI
jgi:hypothetical protein